MSTMTSWCREVLKYMNSNLLQQIACNSQVHSDSLVFLALRMIHRHPPSLKAKHGPPVCWPSHYNKACNEIQNVLRLTPLDISSNLFPTLLRQHLPKQFVDEEVFGVYNTACTFIKHMNYDKAELNEVEDVLKKPTRQCDVCKTSTTKACVFVRPPHGAKPATSAPPSPKKQRGRSTRKRAWRRPPLPRGSQTSSPSTRACSSSTGASRSLVLETDQPGVVLDFLYIDSAY